MGKRVRDEVVFVRMTSDEKERLLQKAEETGYSNLSSYARKMLLDGHVNKVDFSQLKPLIQELGNLNRNLHQIVYRAAMVNDLHEEDYQDILKIWKKDRELINRKLRQIIRTDGEAFVVPEESNGSNENKGDQNHAG